MQGKSHACVTVRFPAATHSSFPGQLRAGSPEHDKSSWPSSRFLPPLPPERCLPGVTRVLKSKRLPAPIKLVVCRQIGSRPERKRAGELRGACSNLQAARLPRSY